MAATTSEVDGECSSEVVEEVAVGHKNGDRSQEEEDCDRGTDTVHDDGVGDEGGGYDDEGVLPEVDKEVRQAEKTEENTGGVKKAVGDFKPPF